MKKYFKRFRDISLKTELYTNLMLVVVVSVVITGVFSFNIAQNSMKDHMVKGMDLAVENKEGQLLEFLELTGALARAFASDGLVVNNTRRILAGERGSVVTELNRHLVENEIPLDKELFGINIIDTEGFVIASSHESEVGETVRMPDTDQFRDLKKGEFFISDIQIISRFGETGPTIRVFSPIAAPASDEPVAFVVNYLNTNTLDDIMAGRRKGELGAIPESEEGELRSLNVYLLNSAGYIITESRHGDYVPFEKQINTTPYTNCKELKETEDIYLNYNNVSVVGSSTCLRNGWTLIAEIDESEALAGVKTIQMNMIIIGAVLLAAAAIVAYFLVKKNVNPVYRLLETVQRFGRGDLSHRAEIGPMNEVGKLTEEFNKMADRLEELDRAKSEFISFVSHQYKNPLSVLSMNTELMLEDENLSEEQKETLKKNMETIKDLNIMVENFLNVSRIELGVFESRKDEVNLVGIIDSILGKLNQKAQSKEIELVKDYSHKNLIVNTDENAVGIIIENLVSNAIKYSREKGKVAIKLGKEEDSAVIMVSDTGYGISKKEQAYIFTKFFRTKRAKEASREGTGLGLYMAKAMTEKIGGKIWFNSREGTGTTFFVSLPLK